MPSDITKDIDLGPLETDSGKEWGNDSLLDIEKDLEDLEDLGDLVLPEGSGLDDLSDLELELDEWEEFMDSHWTKIIE